MPKVGNDLFKSGYSFSSGIEDAVIRYVDQLVQSSQELKAHVLRHRNIQAVAELTDLVRTSFGPQGRNKMVLKCVDGFFRLNGMLKLPISLRSHLEKLFVTSDAATIIREVEVVHPAAKVLVMASQQQEAEMGDRTNLVLMLAGELLKKAEYLLTMGLHPSEIVQGYELARDKAEAELESGQMSLQSSRSWRTEMNLLIPQH